jgi:hypothetical protein
MHRRPFNGLILQINTMKSKVKIEEVEVEDADDESREAIRKAGFLLEYSRGDENTIREIVVQCDRKYRASGLSSLAFFLVQVASMNEYPISIRLMAAESLGSFKEDLESIGESDSDQLIEIKKSCNESASTRNRKRFRRGLDSLVAVMADGIGDDTLASIIKFNKAVEIVRAPDRDIQRKGREFLNSIMDSQSLEPQYKFRLFQSALKTKQLPAVEACSFMERLVGSAIFPTLFRILAAQTIFQADCDFADLTIDLEAISTQLELFATDEGLDVGLRGDAADVLMTYGSEKYKEMARDIIRGLGRTSKTIFSNIYSNAQNVHSQSIEASLQSSIEKLKSENITILSLEDAKERVRSISPEDEKWMQTLAGALQRIEFDSKVLCDITLSSLFRKVVSFIWANWTPALQRRLQEEIEEMVNTCSSGYFSRLVNVLSGFRGYSIQISYKDQIKAVITGRLNKFMKDIIATSSKGDHEFWERRRYEIIYYWLKSQNMLTPEIIPPCPRTCAVKKWLSLNENQWIEAREIYCENLLGEISEHSRLSRPCFRIFYNHCVPAVCDDVRKEYADLLDSDTLELNIRDALCFFEGHN